MTELQEKLNQILDQVQVPERHTFFQIKNFIIGKEYTIQGQLWQIIKELRARKETLESFEYQIQEMEDNLELLNIQTQRFSQEARSATDPLLVQEFEIRIRKSEREKKQLLGSLQRLQVRKGYLLEEITFFVGAFENLAKVQEPKPLDDVSAQKEYWNEKLSEEVNLRLLLNSRLDADLVRTIMALDDDTPVKKHMTSILQATQEQMIQIRDQRRSQESLKKLKG